MTRQVAVLFSPGLHENGGASRRSRLFAEGLADRGWAVRVITRTATDSRLRRSEQGAIRVVSIPGFDRQWLGGPLYMILAVLIGAWWMRTATVALAVQLSAPALAASASSAIWHRPLIAFNTNTGELGEAAAVHRSRLSALRLRLLRRARYLVAQTEDGARELHTVVPVAQTAVIPNPVRAVAAPDLDGCPRAAFAGRLSAEKDLFTLLRAWRCVATTVPGARLTLVGEGGAYRPVEAELRTEVERDPVLAESVTFTGWVPDAHPYLCGSDVFVLPSAVEGMSNALLEALALRRVIVASDIASNRAVVGDTYPLLFPVGDAQALARALHTALTDESVRSEATRLLDDRAPMFHIDTVMGRLLDLIDSARASQR